MKRISLEPGLDTLATDLLDNRRCREIIPQLNDFENAVFGSDFACHCAQIQPWVDSGCLLYSAVAGEAVPGQRRILSVLSVFVTTSAARDRLMLGEIADYELAPWTSGATTAQPTLYLSSVVSAAPHHLSAMYECLLQDVQEFRSVNGIAFHSGFAIATGAAGNRHMSRSGFRLLEGCRYRGSYDLMVIDAQTAATPFWRELLSAETAFLRRTDPAHQTQAFTGAETPALSVLEGDAHEVEKRLALAKTERLRQSLDY